MYKYYKNPKATYSTDKYFVVNKEGKAWFKKKFNKKYVPYFKKGDDKKDIKKNKKDKEPDNEKP